MKTTTTRATRPLRAPLVRAITTVIALEPVLVCAPKLRRAIRRMARALEIAKVPR